MEGFFEAVEDIVTSTIGDNFKTDYLAFIFTIFSFVLMCNLIGLIPYSFTVTSHIAVTITLATIV
jgi:F-type H+-transporting ATPase subunit a